MTKPTDVQRKIMKHMAEGHKLYVDVTFNGRCWLGGKPANENSVHTNTFVSMRAKGYLSLLPIKKWYREDYTLSNLGREVLKQ